MSEGRRPVTAAPAPPPLYLSGQKDDHLNIFYNNYPFNWAINFTLYRLRDPGVIGDIHSFRASSGQLKALKYENDTFSRLIENLQKEQERHNDEIRKFTEDAPGCKCDSSQPGCILESHPSSLALQFGTDKDERVFATSINS